MDTINSLASGAAKLVWGENNTDTTTASDTTTTGANNENQKPLTDRTVNPAANTTSTMSSETQGQEPVSGKLGDVSKGEPFDAGNIEPTNTHTTGVESSKSPLSETSGVAGTHQNAPTTGTSRVTGTHTSPTTETSGVSGTHKNPLAEDTGVSGTQTQAPTTSGDVGESVGNTGPTSKHPSTTGDHGGFKAAQADIRDPETSETTEPKVESARKNVDDTGTLDEGNNPDKVDGPGPKPLEELAREHGGDASKVGGGKDTEAKDDDPEGLHGSSENKGTGEQYVKTSGLKADGGDFDATKPGAGREADRLLEEKGIQTPAAAAAAHKKTEPEDASSSASPDSKKDKPSLKEKIKAKLHKN